MTLDKRARITASKLLGKLGTSVTLTRVVNGGYDPTTGDITISTSTSTTHFAAIKDFSGLELMTGLVQSGDRKVMIPALDTLEPKPTDKITLDGVIYNVLAVKCIWSGKLPAIYQLQVRK